MQRRKKSQRGFTVIEIMVVVVILGVLAKVVIPGFFKETRKTKATTEVSAMFAELMRREESFKVDNGAYRVAAQCPAAPSATAQDISACSAGTDWTALKVQSPEQKLFCTYQIVIGSTAGTNNPAGFTFTSPNRGWYYILATCDMDNNTGAYSTYFTSSVDSTIQKLNEGK